MNNYVAIENYSDGCGTVFTHLELYADHNKYHKTLDVRVTPVKLHGGMVSQVFDFSSNPLTSGIMLARIPMPRKNQKRIDAAQADINGMGDKIANLWNKRDFDGIKALFQ